MKCTDLLVFTFTVEARKPQLGDRPKKAVRPFIASDGVLYLQKMSVGSHRTSGGERTRKRERRKEKGKDQWQRLDLLRAKFDNEVYLCLSIISEYWRIE